MISFTKGFSLEAAVTIKLTAFSSVEIVKTPVSEILVKEVVFPSILQDTPASFIFLPLTTAAK